MVARGSYIRYPHTMTVTRSITSGFPPVSVISDIFTCPCNAQAGTTENENEAMIYDWVVYYDKANDAPLKVNDTVVIDRYGEIYETTVQRPLQGQLTNKIWCNNVSN